MGVDSENKKCAIDTTHLVSTPPPRHIQSLRRERQRLTGPQNGPWPCPATRSCGRCTATWSGAVSWRRRTSGTTHSGRCGAGGVSVWSPDGGGLGRRNEIGLFRNFMSSISRKKRIHQSAAAISQIIIGMCFLVPPPGPFDQ